VYCDEGDGVVTHRLGELLPETITADHLGVDV
jgi:hypothetical protein